MLAIVTADGDAFERVADDDGWGVPEHQALLRVIGFDPGPIDGEVGSMTRSAVLDFQRCANAGVLGLEPESLPESGELDATTVKALYQGFVVASSPSVPLGALHPTHPEIGCSEYNPISREPPVGHLNRRVSLAIHPSLPPYHDAAPCTKGDHGVCPVTQPHNDCMWYREHFIEQSEPASVFFDFQWLKLSDGGAVLSVLTNIPSDELVEFQVWRDVVDFDGSVLVHAGPESLPTRGEAVGSPVPGRIYNGVCFARWYAPDDWSPYAVEDWFVDAEEGAGLRPPLFSVRHSRGWAFSRPPGVRLDRLFFSGKPLPGTLVMSNTGELIRVPDGVMRVPAFDTVHLDEHVLAVGASLPDAWLEPEESEL
ncbi:MAG: peptidoglycan-binding domain-containing protein [Nannocystaceae bacterium]